MKAVTLQQRANKQQGERPRAGCILARLRQILSPLENRDLPQSPNKGRAVVRQGLSLSQIRGAPGQGRVAAKWARQPPRDKMHLTYGHHPPKERKTKEICCKYHTGSRAFEALLCIHEVVKRSSTKV